MNKGGKAVGGGDEKEGAIWGPGQIGQTKVVHLGDKGKGCQLLAVVEEDRVLREDGKDNAVRVAEIDKKNKLVCKLLIFT